MVLVRKMICWTIHLKGGPTNDRHAAVVVGHKLYSFGGFYSYQNNRGQIEVHIFNTVSLRWIKLTPETNGRGQSPFEVPSGRYGHTAVLMEYSIYIWGGYPYCDVLYSFDVDNHRWSKPNVSGTVPKPRAYHSACALGKVMYVYGGNTQVTQCTNDLHKLETTTMVWSLINTRGSPPHVSSSHSNTIIGTKMFVFGGRGNNYEPVSNIIRVFDTETNCWQNKASAQILPEGRMAHSAFAYNGDLYIFGGSGRNQDLNDLWKYNPQTFSWKKMRSKGKALCGMFWMGCCMVGNQIILFGGYKTRDDLYVLDLSPSLKMLCKLAVIQYGVDLSELPHNIRWDLAAMTNKNN